MYIYLNDEIVNEREAFISPFDHGYMYGLGLFETFPVHGGHPFLLDDHLSRLQQGLKELGIEWEMTREKAVSMIEKLLKANHLEHAYVRWNVSAGREGIGLYTGMYKEPTTIVYMKPLPPTTNHSKDAVLLSLRRNTPEGDKRLKSHHYLNNILAKREIGELVNTEGIFLNESGYIAEGIVSNTFWIKGQIVYTPSISTGILNGVTRQFVLALLERKGIKIEVGWYKSHELLTADAAFITNSIQELVPLRKCDEKTYKDHQIIAELMHSFKTYRQRLWSKEEIAEGTNDRSKSTK